jgi:putative ABC transport system ATP-binding protein
LNLIGMLDTPSRGSYSFDGVDVGLFSEAERTRFRGEQVGFVFQDFYLMSGRSAIENVELPLVYAGVPKADRQQASLRLLEQVGLSHRANSFPATMSGGERQRVAIARALIHHPRLLLCDEPTGNLDSATASRILDLVDTLHEGGLTVVTITHDAATAARADRTLTIRDGRIAEKAHAQ